MCSIYVVEENKVVNVASESLELFMFSMCSICVSHMYHVFIFQGGMCSIFVVEEHKAVNAWNSSCLVCVLFVFLTCI